MLFIINQVINNDNILVNDIDIITNDEKRLVKEINMTEAKYPVNKTVYNIFEEQAEKTPNRIAVSINNEKVTILNQTPTFFYNLLEQEIKNEDSSLRIRYIIFGGEALKPNLIKNGKINMLLQN